MNLVRIYNWTWALTIGWILFILYILSSIIFASTVIGFFHIDKIWHFALYAFMPFDKKIILDESIDRNSLEYSVITALWVLFGGIIVIVVHATLGIGFLASLVFVPFGAENMKLVNCMAIPFAGKWIPLTDQEIEELDFWPHIS
ncbi:hypothetical protein P9112_011672 [Eukaryota sp. TZLM1-RC]